MVDLTKGGSLPAVRTTEDSVPAFISPGGYLEGGVVRTPIEHNDRTYNVVALRYPANVGKADYTARLTALMDDIAEASRRTDPNPGVGLNSVLGEIVCVHQDESGLQVEFKLNDAGRALKAESEAACTAELQRVVRGIGYIRDHHGPCGEFRCPNDREA